MEVSEGNHHEEIFDNESYELVNFDKEGRLVRGCGLQSGNTSEDLIREHPYQEQGEAEASHVNVTGVLLTHKVGAPWDKDTD